MNVFRSKALSATPVPVVSTDAAFQAAPEAPSAPFRMLLISFLAAAIGLGQPNPNSDPGTIALSRH